MKAKIFHSGESHELEQLMESWFKEHPEVKIVSVSYAVSSYKAGVDGHHALVVYVQ